MKEFRRDVIRGELTLDYFATKLSERWKVTAIDWSREVTDKTAITESDDILKPEVPFGLRFTEEGSIDENPVEATILLLILEQIVKEKRIQEIASELNAQGYVTRSGRGWNASEVFDLLPRVIEAGPSIFRSRAWQARRPPVRESRERLT